MDVQIFRRKKDGSGSAEDAAANVDDIVRIETTQFANDGQQFKIMILEADDSFDVVVTFPNTESQVVWSLVREREGQ